MNVKVIRMSDSAIQVQIEGVDYSVSDIIHKELLGLRHVKFAGVAPPHPLIKIITIQIHTDGVLPKNTLKEAVNISESKVEELLAVTRETFPNATKVKPTAGELDSQSIKKGKESTVILDQQS